MVPLATFAASAAIGAGKALAGQVSKSLETAASSATQKTDPKAKKTADDFEAMFLEQSLDRLTASQGTDGPMGENGTAGGVYRSMMSQQYAGQIAKAGGVGVSDQVYDAIIKMQAGDAKRG